MSDSPVKCSECWLHFETLQLWQRHSLDTHALIPRRPKPRLHLQP